MSEFPPFRSQKGRAFWVVAIFEFRRPAFLAFSMDEGWSALWYGASGHLVLLRFSDRLYLTTMMRRISFDEFLYCCGSFSIHALGASRPWVLLVFSVYGFIFFFFKKIL
ncbi:hypothetical protein BDV26DRAFT_164838 [Aspergillus bertholletiae]|uniref:Transmembrane protein n=1 Tax=Aspergillus bertholletiae TaxID=1226010 RepID=A0A5N7BCJ3_9EURO|nr:hypothetical protein BDV26DRAFT_164838 [Aspergillus bertholletiae]